MVSSLLCGCSPQRLLMLEELHNCNNDDKIEMAFPAEQELEGTRRFSHPTYCFWHQAPTAPGRQMSGPAAGLFELWLGGQWRSLGNFRSICRGFPPQMSAWELEAEKGTFFHLVLHSSEPSKASAPSPWMGQCTDASTVHWRRDREPGKGSCWLTVGC